MDQDKLETIRDYWKDLADGSLLEMNVQDEDGKESVDARFMWVSGKWVEIPPTGPVPQIPTIVENNPNE